VQDFFCKTTVQFWAYFEHKPRSKGKNTLVQRRQTIFQRQQLFDTFPRCFFASLLRVLVHHSYACSLFEVNAEMEPYFWFQRICFK
jgi:hypothetical protein